MSEFESLLLVDDLRVGYGKRNPILAVNGVSFRANLGDFWAVAGPAGGGKSSLLAVLAGVPGDAVVLGGEVSIAGQSLSGHGGRKQNALKIQLGYLAQEAAMQLEPTYTVAENIVTPITSRYKNWDQADLAKRVLSAMAELELEARVATRYPHELSSGQRQRVAIAKSLVLEPKIWIADEPTRGVDIIAREAVIQFMQRKKRDGEMIQIVASSDHEVINELAEHILVLDEANVVENASADFALSTPVSSYMQKYLALKL